MEPYRVWCVEIVTYRKERYREVFDDEAEARKYAAHQQQWGQHRKVDFWEL